MNIRRYEAWHLYRPYAYNISNRRAPVPPVTRCLLSLSVLADRRNVDSHVRTAKKRRPANHLPNAETRAGRREIYWRVTERRWLPKSFFFYSQCQSRPPKHFLGQF